MCNISILYKLVFDRKCEVTTYVRVCENLFSFNNHVGTMTFYNTNKPLNIIYRSKALKCIASLKHKLFDPIKFCLTHIPPLYCAMVFFPGGFFLPLHI